MSIYSYWRWGCHGLDTSGYDHADDMVDKFTKLLNNLDKHIANYESNKEIVDADFKNVSVTLQSNNAGTQGHWLHFYNGKVCQWKSHKYSFYSKMEQEFELAKSRRDYVANQKTSWETTKSNEATALDQARQRQIEEEEARRRQAEREAAAYLKSLLK
ncbi:hypothetical protein [Pseudobutyrivibrio xylanivorans]|uniref:Uncharacterized protein n=1 Tax=Pseudobutyrivibrio xylanivorans TaxID=185007 RepID=A0A5P6VN00_PSEXY|nr:hypothetical protein [Pseudobutyrivibrio xylanivorans]QFJ53728.1 hypothetical protein FXF36_02010 [Pseudobutyrivibrio xylanivorans]